MTVENHNQIILKHENMLKEFMTYTSYQAKNDTFQKSIELRVESDMLMFNQKVLEMLRSKIDLDEFNRRIRDKATVSELGAVMLEITAIADQIKLLKSTLEQKADGKTKSPALEEFERLEKKADRTDVDNLRLEVQRLEALVNRMEEAEGDYFSDSEEDSEVDDVISLDGESPEGKDADDDADIIREVQEEDK